MAKSMHVKANKPWKRIQIPKEEFGPHIFDGLVDLQVLTDYEFTKGAPSLEKKNRKRTADDVADTKTQSSGSKKKKMEESISTQAKLNDESGNKDKPKKRKGKSRKKNSKGTESKNSIDDIVAESGIGNTSDTSTIIESEQKSTDGSKLKKGKSRAKKNITTCDSDSHSKSRVAKKPNSDLEGIQVTKPKKSKKKKRKKEKSSDESVTPTENDAVEQNEMKNCDLDMSKWSNLFVPEVLLRSMQEQGFQNPTTIQTLSLPSAIRDMKDILAAAETGSGKTLAFGIPVLSKVLEQQERDGANGQQTDIGNEEDEAGNDQGLDVDMESDKESSDGDDDDDDDDGIESTEDPDTDNDDFDCESALEEAGKGGKPHDHSDHDDDTDSSVKGIHSDHPPQVLILEPTRELAVQVHTHLSKLAKFTNINFATVVGGMSVEKQRRLLKRLPEVIIATPGRLWQLIEEGDEHLGQIDLIHSLVVDEADRMVEKGHYEELTHLLRMINKSRRRNEKRQSFVMSATLTMEVAVPKRLLNKKKKKNMEKDKLKSLTKKICLGTKPKVFDLTPKEKTAQSLTEMKINCSMDEKDYYLYYFLSHHPGRTLVFANSKDCLRRLVSVFNLLNCSPFPLHADMQQRQRLKNLDRFSAKENGLLLASDVAARGLDIPNVDYVIHYQVPYTKENYVHRSGRTARASNVGLSVMLVSPEDARNYNKIVHGVKNGEDVPLLPVDSELLPAVKKRVNLARSIDVAEHRSKKVRLHNDFFLKAAEEMDMIVDEEYLVPTEDAVIQAEEKNRLKGMRSQLSSMLKGSLAPLRMTKYPTKSGKLVSMESVNLLKTS